MKRFLMFLLGLIPATALVSQVPSTCHWHPNLVQYYADDVRHLALERIFKYQSPYRDSIDIPQAFQDSIWDGLSAIFNATTIPERDSVFDSYCIHHDISSYAFRSLAVKIDQSCPWFYNWKGLNIQTGVPDLDALFSQYGFTIQYFTFTNWVFFNTEQSLNVTAFCNEIKGFDFILDAHPSGYLGDGSEIFYSTAGSDRYFDFKLGFGDCPAGCTGNHTYKFQVYKDCSVKFLGTVDQTIPGLPLPWPVNCRITGVMESVDAPNAVILYPNPVDDRFYIKAGLFQAMRYEIRNAFGQVVSGGSVESGHPVEVGDLPSGMYLVSMYDDMNGISKPLKMIRMSQ